MKKTAVVTAAKDAPLFGGRMQTCIVVFARRVLSISLMMGVIMALAGNVALGEGGVSLVMNGSFENDGEITNIASDAPRYWCDVNIPTDKFGGRVDTAWSTHPYGYGDSNSLTLYSKMDSTFTAGDIAMVSQYVYLTDANQIIFDIKLGTDWPDIQWDPDERSAVLLIDGNSVWDSDDCVPDENGECLNVVVEVNDINVNDADLHMLSLAIRSDVNGISYIEYWAQWDFVKFDAYCGGFGYLWEDLNLDCYVDMLDLEMLVGQWLVEDPNEEYDLYQDGIVDFRDFAFFAEYWMCNTDWQNWQSDNCFEMELLAGDIDDSGEVSYGDIATFVDNWLSGGSCNRADLNEDGIVNFRDFAIIADQWLQISWLSRL